VAISIVTKTKTKNNGDGRLDPTGNGMIAPCIGHHYKRNRSHLIAVSKNKKVIEGQPSFGDIYRKSPFLCWLA
jgi:hypothetical protein